MAARSQFLPAIAAGLGQGLTFNFGDELLRLLGQDNLARGMAQLQEDEPLAFGLGNTAGAVLLPWNITNRIMRAAAPGRDYLTKAAGFDATFGAAQGAGGYEVGDRPWEERLGEATIAGGVGGLTAGLVPLAFHNARQLDMALPALMRGEPPKNAAMALSFTSAGPAGALDTAIARDAGALHQGARQAGREPSIFAPFGEANLRPVDVDAPNVRGLFEAAMRDPGARAIYEDATAETFRSDVLESLRRVSRRAPKGQAAPPIPKGKEARAALKDIDPDWRADLMAALDDPDAHAQWIAAAKRLFRDKPDAAAAFGGEIVERLRRRARGAAHLETLATLRAEISKGGALREKLNALGVGLGRNARRLDAADRDAARLSTRASGDSLFTSTEDRLTARTTPQERPVGRVETEAADQALREGTAQPAGFLPADAQALMRLLTTQRRLNYVPADFATTPLLEAVPQPGVRWANPFAVDPRISEPAYLAGKFTVPLTEQLRSESGGVPGAAWDEFNRQRRRVFGSRRAA